jgi:uncharacterized protein YlxP (DUF503 family)
MNIGILTLHLYLPGCSSLKEKRSRIKPLIHRLHREFNISVAEVDHQDKWKDAVIACALVSNENAHIHRSFLEIIHWIETSWQDINVVEENIEIV